MIGRNELVRATSPARIRARDTGEREELECGLVLRSIGYLGTGLEGIPFDAASRPDPERGRPGRSTPRPATRSPATTPSAGSSAARRASSARTRRTPTRRSQRSSRTWRPEPIPDPATPRTPGGEAEDVAPIAELLDERGGDHVTYMGWQAIDAAEVRRRRATRPPAGEVLSRARDGRGARSRGRPPDGRRPRRAPDA